MKIHRSPINDLASLDHLQNNNRSLTATVVAAKKIIVIVAIIFIALLSSLQGIAFFLVDGVECLDGDQSSRSKDGKIMVFRTSLIKFCIKLSIPATLNTRPSSRLDLCWSNS